MHTAASRKEKLEKLRRFEENLQEMKDRLAKLEKILFENSDKLSRIRREYSSQLEQKVIQGLKDLNFLDVNFAIDFQRKKNYTDNGFDDIGYLISTNPGESLKPLGQIVSGGELSRIMLALKAILADREPDRNTDLRRDRHRYQRKNCTESIRENGCDRTASPGALHYTSASDRSYGRQSFRD